MIGVTSTPRAATRCWAAATFLPVDLRLADGDQQLQRQLPLRRHEREGVPATSGVRCLLLVVVQEQARVGTTGGRFCFLKLWAQLGERSLGDASPPRSVCGCSSMGL